MKRSILLIICFLMASSWVYAQNTVTITDSDINGDVVWTKDNTYVLDGFVFVEDGESLTIEAGTVIKGKPGQGENASALIVARGGKIYAEGTPNDPIIFTAEADDISNPNDIPAGTRGLWGGVLLLGKAKINTTAGEGQVEGIPSTEPRGAYGGNDDNDNSGVMRYVSIRYGGTDIGAGNEINGLTFAAVGRGTTIDHIEVYSNSDDGYEFFGGTVEPKYMVSAFNADDGFDYDEGFRGKGQFWFVIQDPETANRGGEHDGGTDPEDGQPYAKPTIYNATYIGSGVDGTAENDHAIIMRDNAGGKYYNSIFTQFAGDGLNVEDLSSGEDSRKRLEAGDIEYSNNIWYGFGAGNDAALVFPQGFVRSAITASGLHNDLVDPQLTSVSRTMDGGLDPRPKQGSPAYENVKSVPDDDFFTQVDYRGAFGSGSLWTDGWTYISELGYLPELNSNTVTVTDSDIDGDVHWTNDNTYLLDGFVFVEDGETLTIDPGTVIKGKPGQGENASALIIARGGKIFAQGTPDQPIIFTAEADDIDNLNDIPSGTRGLWGGVLLLGRAQINTTAGEGQVEGIPSTEPRGAYGGNDDNDNSGVMEYVSIRYGGTDIGAGNEINGVTFAAVGRGTTIDHIEVYSNADDGYEFFGGTVEPRHMISAFNADDGFDYDEGFRGKGQFWFVIQDPATANRGGEHDGGTDPEDGKPYAKPIIYNATYIGSGVNGTAENDHAIIMRDNAGGKYYNSIFTQFAGDGLNVEDLSSGEDSRKRLEAGDIEYKNNIWWGFGVGNTAADIFPQDFVRSVLTASDMNNDIVDPQLNGISHSMNGGLDPRPAKDGPAYENVLPPVNDSFDWTSYRGAFGQTNWAADWSYIAQLGILTEKGAGTYTSVDKEQNNTRPDKLALSQNYPNPFNPTTTINFELPATQQVTLRVYDMMGRMVSTLINGKRSAGQHRVSFDASHLSSGVYFYRLTTGTNSITKKMTLLK